MCNIKKTRICKFSGENNVKHLSLKIRTITLTIFLESTLYISLPAVKAYHIFDGTTHQKIANNHLTISTLLYPTNCRIQRTVNGPTFKFCIYPPLSTRQKVVCFMFCFTLPSGLCFSACPVCRPITSEAEYQSSLQIL